jgi:hypothetical protein
VVWGSRSAASIIETDGNVHGTAALCKVHHLVTRVVGCKNHVHKARCLGVVEGHCREYTAGTVIVIQGPVEDTCGVIRVLEVAVVVGGGVVIESGVGACWGGKRVIH